MIVSSTVRIRPGTPQFDQPIRSPCGTINWYLFSNERGVQGQRGDQLRWLAENSHVTLKTLFDCIYLSTCPRLLVSSWASGNRSKSRTAFDNIKGFLNRSVKSINKRYSAASVSTLAEKDTDYVETVEILIYWRGG